MCNFRRTQSPGNICSGFNVTFKMIKIFYQMFPFKSKQIFSLKMAALEVFY